MLNKEKMHLGMGKKEGFVALFMVFMQFCAFIFRLVKPETSCFSCKVGRNRLVSAKCIFVTHVFGHFFVDLLTQFRIMEYSFPDKVQLT